MKKMIKILRVEHSFYENDNVFAGPYGVSDVVDSNSWDKKKRHSNMNTHPNPFMDKILKKSFVMDSCLKNYNCGFKNLKQLREWFNKEELKALKRLDFTIREYLINPKNLVIGQKQVVFKSNKKTKKKELNSLLIELTK